MTLRQFFQVHEAFERHCSSKLICNEGLIFCDLISSGRELSGFMVVLFFLLSHNRFLFSFWNEKGERKLLDAFSLG